MENQLKTGATGLPTESQQPPSNVVTEENFTTYFHPAREDYKPQKGECLARWRATADFVDGWVKRNIIELLATHRAGAETANRVMSKLVSATQRDAVRVLFGMAQDLVNGLSVDEVAEKPYRFTVEQFYWVNREYVPDDPHWDIINVKDTRVDDVSLCFKPVSSLNDSGTV